MYFLSGLEFVGHAFDVKQEQQQHTALSQATSLSVTLTVAVQWELYHSGTAVVLMK